MIAIFFAGEKPCDGFLLVFVPTVLIGLSMRFAQYGQPEPGVDPLEGGADYTIAGPNCWT